MSVKICMLAFKHSAYDGRILFKESVSLQKNGYQVSVLAPCDEKKGLMDPSLHKYTGESQAEYEGIRIIGVKKKRGIVWVLHNLLRFYKKALELDADVYHCHEGDVSVLVGILVKRKLEKKGRKVKLIYDVHEYWPGAFSQMFKNPILQRIGFSLFMLWERFALKHCDLIFTANQIVRGHLLLIDRFLKVEVLYNCPRLDLSYNKGKKRQELILCHEGSLTFKRGLRSLVESLIILKKQNFPVKLLLVGDVYGKEKQYLANEIERNSLHDQIEITGWLPYPKIGEYIAKADLGLILFKPTVNNMLAGPPNKLFNYMLSGLCVLSVDLPETGRLVRENSCGILLNSLEPAEIAAKIKYLFSNPALMEMHIQKGIKAAREKYNWEKMQERLLGRYKEILQ